MTDVNIIFLQNLVLIALGYIMKRKGVFTYENGRFLAKLIFTITLPAVLLQNLNTITFNLSLGFMPFFMIGYCIAISLFVFILTRRTPPDQKGMFLMATIGFNIGNFAFPFIEGIWGTEGMQYLLLLDMGNAMIMFSLMYAWGAIFSPTLANQATQKLTKGSEIEDKEETTPQSHHHTAPKVEGRRILQSLFKSVPFVSYIIGVSLNLAGVHYPSFVVDILDILGRANMSLVLIVLGIFLEFHFTDVKWKLIGKIILVRYSAGLLFGIGCYYLLPLWIDFPEIARIIMIVTFILPMGGIMLLSFSVEFGYDNKVAGTMGNLTIIISFILMWVIFLIFG